MTIETVDFPIKDGDFPQLWLNYQSLTAGQKPILLDTKCGKLQRSDASELSIVPGRAVWLDFLPV